MPTTFALRLDLLVRCFLKPINHRTDLDNWPVIVVKNITCRAGIIKLERATENKSPGRRSSSKSPTELTSFVWFEFLMTT